MKRQLQATTADPTPILLGNIRPGDLVAVVPMAVAKSLGCPTLYGVSTREVSDPLSMCQPLGVVIATIKACLINPGMMPALFAASWHDLGFTLRYDIVPFDDSVRALVVCEREAVFPSTLSITIGTPDAVVYKVVP